MPNFQRTSSGKESASQNLFSQEGSSPTLPPSSDDNPSPVLQTTRDGVIRYANRASQPLLQEWGCGLGDRLGLPLQGAIAQAIASGDVQETDSLCGQQTYRFKLVPLTSQLLVNLYGWEVTVHRQIEQTLQGVSQKLSRLMSPAKARFHGNSAELQLKIWDCLSVQQHLREQQRQLNAIFREAGIGIALLDVEGRILRTNPALQQMLELPEAGLQGTYFLEAIALNDALEAPVAEVEQRGKLQVKGKGETIAYLLKQRR